MPKAVVYNVLYIVIVKNCCYSKKVNYCIDRADAEYEIEFSNRMFLSQLCID